MARKTSYETLRGKVQWAKVKRPNKFGKWSLDLYPDEASLPKLHALKEDPAVKNHLRKDENGEFMTFSRDCQKLIRGKMVLFQPPQILDKDNNPIDAAIGNGSDCDVTIEVYIFENPQTKLRGRAARLHAIKVWNLIPFDPERDFTTQEFVSVSGLLEQSPPSWNN
jgi:hypothetical protein